MTPYDVALLAFAVLVLVAASVVVALGAIAWGRAVQTMIAARSHSAQVAAEEAVLRAGAEAVEDRPRARAPRPVPTDAEIREALIRQRSADAMNGQVAKELDELDVDRNDGREREDAFRGGMYNS